MKTFSMWWLALVLGPMAPAQEGGHHHAAPHGGTLVELGDHQFNLEFVRDAAAGTLTAYVLDAHAENFVRLPLKSFDLAVEFDGQQAKLVLAATPNELSGETVGDTAQFTARAGWLKDVAAFKGVIATIEVRGTVFKDTVFKFKTGVARK